MLFGYHEGVSEGDEDILLRHREEGNDQRDAVMMTEYIVKILTDETHIYKYKRKNHRTQLRVILFSSLQQKQQPQCNLRNTRTPG